MLAARETLFKQIRQRGQPDASEPYVHEPEVGIHEHGLKRQPAAGCALLVHEARGAHCALRLRRITEIQKKLVQLAELPAR
jgi:ABC-type transporter Mla MlaB component